MSNIKVFSEELPHGEVYLGEKSIGLIELDRLGIKTPQAIIIPGDYFIRYTLCDGDGKKECIANLVYKIEKFICKSTGDLFSFRGGSKKNKNLLPESVLNIGLNKEYIQNHIKCCQDEKFINSLIITFFQHLCAYASCVRPFLNADAFFTLNLSITNQIEMLLVSYYQYFSQLKINTNLGQYDIIIQKMVYGNYDCQSLTGMCYTRNPYTGQKEDYGRFILGRQGLSLGGISSRLLYDLSEMRSSHEKIYNELSEICVQIEGYYQDIRCLEYTLQTNDLYILQNTIGNRTFIIKGGNNEY